MSRIAVLGAGYVGLTTAACFSHLGHQVICADVLPDRVDLLARGEVPIREAGLEEQRVGNAERTDEGRQEVHAHQPAQDPHERRLHRQGAIQGRGPRWGTRGHR